MKIKHKKKFVKFLSVMRWVERYKKDGNVDIHYRKPVAYKVKKNM
ncbi:hypothetical protein 162285270 [Organic Lake phycodnavirus 1]|nr:hypothetical protein 162285270 [Organic Lake phycodnavirus 1]